MIKEIIQSFLPWILFFVFASQKQLNTAIIIAAITSIIFEFKGLKKGFILSWGTLIFFIFMFVMVVMLDNKWIARHSWIFSNGSLAAIAWISILIGKPFTIQYAKEQVSKDRWQSPLFLKINYILTLSWGIVFLINIGLHIIKNYEPLFNGWTYEIISYVPSICGIWFTTWFPDWCKQKYLSKNSLR